jgi:hypothetical protein
MVTLAAETVAPVESITVPDRSPLRSAKAGATTNKQLNSAAIAIRAAFLSIDAVPPKRLPQEIPLRALLPPGQSSSKTGAGINARLVPADEKESMFLQYVQNVAVSENKSRVFITRAPVRLRKYTSYMSL